MTAAEKESLEEQVTRLEAMMAEILSLLPEMDRKAVKKRVVSR